MTNQATPSVRTGQGSTKLMREDFRVGIAGSSASTILHSRLHQKRSTN